MTYLNESVSDFKAMIQPVINAINPDDADISEVAERYRAKIAQDWADMTARARTKLVKADRVTWFLKKYRASLFVKWGWIMGDGVADKWLSRYAQKQGGLHPSHDGLDGKGIDPEELLGQLEHFASLPVQELKQFPYGGKSILVVLNQMEDLEHQWIRTLDGTIEDDSATPFIDCGDGFYWVNTNKAFCSNEAKAMGHCGNQPRQHSGDKVLSLRKKIEGTKNSTRWRPSLTFILRNDGMLTEMKGRANEKPHRKYHPHIVKLLLDPIVKGIVGGGYQPENNFAMEDLDDSLRDDVVAKKPSLGTLDEHYAVEGDSDTFRARLEHHLHEMGTKDAMVENDTIVFEEFSTDSFIRTYLSGVPETLNDMKGEWFDDAWFELDADDALEEIADDAFLAHLSQNIGVSEDKALAAALSLFPNHIGELFKQCEKYAADLAAEELAKVLVGMEPNMFTLRVDAENDTIAITYSVDGYMEYYSETYDPLGNFSVEDVEDDGAAERVYNQTAQWVKERIVKLFHDPMDLDFEI